jgi:hypothetical protein
MGGGNGAKSAKVIIVRVSFSVACLMRFRLRPERRLKPRWSQLEVGNHALAPQHCFFSAVAFMNMKFAEHISSWQSAEIKCCRAEQSLRYLQGAFIFLYFLSIFPVALVIS